MKGEKLIEIEDQYPSVAQIKINSLNIWTVLRMVLRYNLLVSKNNTGTGKPSVFKNALKYVRDLAILAISLVSESLHFSKWFSQYDYIIFSNDLERKQVGGVMIDKLAYGLIDILGAQKVLIVNYPISTEKKFRNVQVPHVVNGGLIILIARLLLRLKLRIPEADRKLIHLIASENKLESNSLHDVGIILKKMKVIDFLIRRWKPKAIFTGCYTYYAECYAGKKEKVTTIELQHGLISSLHPGYQSKLTLDKSFVADYLLTFGENSTSKLNGSIVNLDNVRAVGNFYIEKLSTQPYDQSVIDLIKNFETSVCIPTDMLTEKELIDLIIPVAQHSSAMVFLIVPRLQLMPESEKKIADFKNIKIVANGDFQNVVRHCTVHTASISTCCLEALSLGVPNILFNVGGRPEEIYGELLDRRHTVFVKTLDDYRNALASVRQYSKFEIMSGNQKNFRSHYTANMSTALKEILGDKVV